MEVAAADPLPLEHIPPHPPYILLASKVRLAAAPHLQNHARRFLTTGGLLPRYLSWVCRGPGRALSFVYE